MKRITLTGIIIALLSAVIVGSSGYSIYKYLTADKNMLGAEPDQTGDYSYYDSHYYRYGDNINVILTRTENWKQIASEKLLSQQEEFAGIDGSTATVPITAELARQFCGVSDDVVANYVSHNTTHGAYMNLIHGDENYIQFQDTEWHLYHHQVRLIFATPPSEDEYDLAHDREVKLEVEPVALDGFVFITHKDNPVDSLTVQQIKDIYTGKITNWKEVGGNDEEIRAYQREKNSGSQTAMEELVMEGEPLIDAPITFVPMAMGALVEAVAEYENGSAAIGYTYCYYINNLYKNADIKVLNIEGVSPEHENLVSKEYPFSTAYYVVIRSDEPEDSVYRKLRDYMLTDEGQEIIRMAGYCPVNG